VRLPNGRTVTVVRRQVGGRDSDGNDVYTDVETDVDGCAVWPASSSELTDARDTAITGLTVLFPPGTALAATDQVRIDDEPYKVDGEPGTWTSPLSGYAAGVQASLVRVTG
jgi:hypothetical protein